MLNQLINNPKQIFLTDSIGAMLTASILCSIAIGFPTFFGIPPHIVFILSAIAFTFAVYSFCCSYFMPARWRGYLMAIMIANAFYAVVTTGLVYNFYSSITRLGLFYFIAEIVVILFLILLEYKVLSKSRS
ncbi:hypothetical protein [Lacibacter sp. H407]|uniref:hypothetical protein n=1 Tax=Lacibacter sp. H407 TaxID=3133423 RepID=UPI0030BE0611